MAHVLEICQPFKHGIGKNEMSEDMSGQLRGSHSIQWRGRMISRTRHRGEDKFRMRNGDQVVGSRMMNDADTRQELSRGTEWRS